MKLLKSIMAIMALFALSVQATTTVWNQQFELVIPPPVWDEDFSDPSLHANWVVSASADGTVTHTNSTLVMSTGTSNKFQRAGIVNFKDPSGVETNASGADIYDFYDHEVSVRFDIAEMLYGTSVGQGRNHFYFSIGDSTGGSAVPGVNNGLKDGVGFMLEFVESPKGPWWRIQYGPSTNSALDSVAAGQGTVPTLGRLSTRPTAIVWTLDGTNSSITVEGATFTTNPFKNQTTATKTLPDYSSNLSIYRLGFGVRNDLEDVTVPTQVTLSNVSVDYAPLGGEINPNLVEHHTSGGAAITTNGLVLAAANINNSAQGVLRTSTDETGLLTEFEGEQLFNYNAHKVVTRFDIEEFDSDPGAGKGMFWFAVGDFNNISNSDPIAPLATLMDYGVGIRLTHLTDTNALSQYQFDFYSASNSVKETEVSGIAVLSACPTAVTYTLEGSLATIELEGAVTTDLGTQAQGTIGESSFSIPLKSYLANTVSYIPAFGVRNVGLTAEPSSITLSGFNVSVEGTAAVDPYTAWSISWGEAIGSKTNDFDGDGLSNLAEYALNGNPTNSADAGQVRCEMADGELVYVHAQHGADNSLAYWLETTDDLVNPSWTNAGTIVAGTNMTGQAYNQVTNAVSTDADQMFIRLRVQK